MRHQYGLDQLSATGDDWRTRAACIGYDPEWWHSPVAAEREFAKEVCRDCPVQTACLTWALDVGDAWAVLGGTDPHERRTGLPAEQPEEPTGDVSGICMMCDAPFTTISTSGRMYCSNRCNQAAHRQRKKIVEGAPA